MRQRLELYIAGQKADIGTESPVLFNYTVEELRNPTVVKNAYSQQMKLKGTPANNRIFQFYFRADATPGGFNPSKRVPFSIFADGGRTVEAGYVKLNSISVKGNDVEYAVTLYGGLGGFLYSLQYNEDKVKSFADLQFTKENGDDIDLGFTIDRAAVAEAWQNAYTAASKWSLINFAPCYQGIPDKFDAGRALVKAAKYGLETQKTEDGKQYTARNGFAMIDLPEDMTEWQVKDLRSYHQRPVLSVRALFRAICNPANNGGYNVELDSNFFSEFNQLFYSAWITLKKLTSLTLQKIYGTYDSGRVETSTEIISFPTDAPADSTGAALITAGISQFNVPDSVAVGTDLYWYAIEHGAIQDKRVTRGIIMQAVGYDAEGNAICGSKVVAFGPDGLGGGWSCKQFCQSAGYTPVYDTGEGDDMYAQYIEGHFTVTAASVAEWSGQAASLNIESTGRVSFFRIYATRVIIVDNYSSTWPYLQTVGGGYSTLDTDRVDVDSAIVYGEVTYNYETSGAVRSGTELTQAMYLSDTMSPAEFLLSYCKRFGLSIRVENDRKLVHIEKRSTTYEDDTVTDISDRIDRSRAVEVTPVPFDAQKFELSETDAGAGYAKDYKNRFGIEYGAKRLNTGFEFNADVKKLLDSSKFKTAPEVKTRDLCFLNVTNPGQTPSTYPAVFLNSGLKYHLFAANNRDTDELVVPSVPATVVYEYWDPDYKTYDDIPRLQLCDNDGKGIDGDGVLVLYQGRRNLPEGFYLSDDMGEMYFGNNENPCWILEARDAFGPSADARLMAPGFGRFRYGDSRHTQITETVELGMPLELDIPDVTIMADIDVYAGFWARYMSDRYSPRTKVMTCYVYAEGMRFDASSLRHFFWIDGARWVLNKISDYDLNGNGLCKCEFVQVQDINNYVIQ